MAIVDNQGLTEEQFLESYDASRFERPSVTVDILLFTIADNVPENYRKLPEKVLKVLLIKRGGHPFLGQWALPGGFVGLNESLDEAALRELSSETNVGDLYLEQLYTWGAPDRDPRTRVISCSYMALVDSSSIQLKAGDDAVDARWFAVRRSLLEQKKNTAEKGFLLEEVSSLELSADNLSLNTTIKSTKTVKGRNCFNKREIIDSTNIAFDHPLIIEYGIERLRNKIEYTDIAFNLMPELFTLTELQQVYEIILGKELLKANFRRKISDMVLETEFFTKDDGHRPARLYRMNTNWVG
jgi:8-oxo-dGTP diphosphatase